ncbi:MAG TPA: PQQ-dependent sugar dehydrogenase [Blastocatellia bacterium]|jgi:glucose/arabinose dehydrogenase|nr:PQQ-dependent sugar dehydrogenase [Blastocatellia bacterium]
MTRTKFLLSCIAIVGALCPPLNHTIAGSLSSASVVQDQTPLEIRPDLVQVFSGLNNPVYVTNAHDGTNRLFVIERPGRIRVAQPGATATSVFLDISASVLSSGGEQGLLGLAFHPQFAANRRFFVDYTRRGDGATVIAEYRVSQSNPNVADADETVLLVIPQPFANHNGGMVEFGREGFLYIGMGDGGSGNDPGNRAQNTNELLGKILRIDVDHREGSQPYSSPASNPFSGSTPGRDEIYAYGLRNPWRFSFDRATGELYAADVGQGAREEIDIITRGGNYGWRVMEGNSCTNNDPALCAPSRFVAPIAEYNHTNGRCSITGGYVYRGTQSSLPTGAYVYGDFCTGELFLLSGSQSSMLMDTGLSVSSFGEDEAGEIYVVSLGGTVHRIVNTNPPPPSGSFKIVNAIMRRRSSGETLQPVTTKSNGKKYEVVVFEEGAAPTLESRDAVVLVNGREMKTTYTTTEAGAPVFVARLRKETIRRPGLLTIEVVRTNGARSNQVTIQVVD